VNGGSCVSESKNKKRFAGTAYADELLPDGDEKGGSKTSVGNRKKTHGLRKS